MTQGPTPAAKSLTADYVSQWNFLSIFHVWKASHHISATIIVGTFLIELLTVASTGLFELQTVTLEDAPIELIAQAKFDENGFDGSAVDGSAALTVAGIGMYNLTYPSGTTDQYAFQPFNVSIPVSGMSIPFTTSLIQ